MCSIALVVRKNTGLMWGGDLLALQVIEKGIKECGHNAFITDEIEETLPSSVDYVFLSNTCLNLEPLASSLTMHAKRFGIIPFHEDRPRYKPVAHAFFDQALEGKEMDSAVILKRAASYPLPTTWNREVLPLAEVCVANSETEKATILRHAPESRVAVVHWTPGFAEGAMEEPSDAFLRFTGLSSKSYILQVGRFEHRKNQMGTILATENLDIPLVFIAAFSPLPSYERACLETIFRRRRAPTYVISEKLPTMSADPLKVLQMPGGKPLSRELLLSAFHHAGLHLHPAFQELPGYTYLESARLGTPTIASTWTTINEYFIDPVTKSYSLDSRLSYADPLDLARIKELVIQEFGKRYPRAPEHPIFRRQAKDVAKEILALL